MSAETRLDRLWRQVSEAPEEDARWLAFYEGLATARLWLPLAEPGGERLRPRVLELSGGRVVLAFDTEDRLAGAIGQATERAAMEGAALARLLAPEGLGLALNPGAAPSETVLEAAQVAWLAEAFGGEAAAETAAGRLVRPAAPSEALLAALGARIADFGGAVAEAWLAGFARRGEGDGLLLVLSPAADLPAEIADRMAGTLARLGQGIAAGPFAVALEGADSPRLAEARVLGIGIGGRSGPGGQ